MFTTVVDSIQNTAMAYELPSDADWAPAQWEDVLKDPSDISDDSDGEDTLKNIELSHAGGEYQEFLYKITQGVSQLPQYFSAPLFFAVVIILIFSTT